MDCHLSVAFELVLFSRNMNSPVSQSSFYSFRCISFVIVIDCATWLLRLTVCRSCRACLLKWKIIGGKTLVKHIFSFRAKIKGNVLSHLLRARFGIGWPCYLHFIEEPNENATVRGRAGGRGRMKWTNEKSKSVTQITAPTLCGFDRNKRMIKITKIHWSLIKIRFLVYIGIKIRDIYKTETLLNV